MGHTYISIVLKSRSTVESLILKYSVLLCFCRVIGAYLTDAYLNCFCRVIGATNIENSRQRSRQYRNVKSNHIDLRCYKYVLGTVERKYDRISYVLQAPHGGGA
jgi:hypothetical protein